MSSTPREVWWLSKAEKRMAAARVVGNQTGSDRMKHGEWKWHQVTVAFKDPQTYFFFFTTIVNSLPKYVFSYPPLPVCPGLTSGFEQWGYNIFRLSGLRLFRFFQPGDYIGMHCASERIFDRLVSFCRSHHEKISQSTVFVHVRCYYPGICWNARDSTAAGR